MSTPEQDWEVIFEGLWTMVKVTWVLGVIGAIVSTVIYLWSN